jgi:hypothetical protein
MRNIYCLLIALIISNPPFAQLGAELHLNQQALLHSDDPEFAANKKLAFNPLPGAGESSAMAFGISNPASITSALNPSRGTAGRSGFAVSVSGPSLSPSSVLQWKGSNRNTTFVSSTQLPAAIRTAEIASAGTAQLQVSNLDGQTSSPIALSGTSDSSEWTFLGAPNINGTNYPNVGQIVVDSEDQRILYVSVYSTGLFTSRDGGVSWTLAVPGTAIGYIALDPNSVDRLFFGEDP